MLTVQNKNYHILAYLNNLEEAKVKETLNGEYVLSFIALIDPIKTECLYDDKNYVVYNDDLFKVIQFTELHNEDDKVVVEVECEHVSYDLINNSMNDFNYSYKSASEVMTQCLLGTEFTLRYCNITLKTDIQYTEECNSKQISIAIANNWNGELKYYRYYIDLLQRRGANRGTDFRFGKNIKSVKRIRNKVEDTLSYEIELVEGTEFEELSYYELGDTVRVIDDRLNIDIYIRITEIERDILTGLNTKVVLGDKIKDLRSSFSNTDSKISEAEKKAKEAAEEAYNKAIESGKSAEEALKASQEAYQKALEAYEKVETIKSILDDSKPDWDKINDITNDLGNVLANKVFGDLNLSAISILNSTGTFEQKNNGLYWQNQPTQAASTFASMWNASGIMFANSKNSDGSWQWQSALDANGLTATKIVASALYGVTMQAVNILAGTITGGTITGVTIEGSTLYAGDRRSGNYTEITIDGVVNCYTNGLRTISLVRRPNGIIDVGRDIDSKNYMRISSDQSITIGDSNVFEGMGMRTQNGSQLIFDAQGNRIIFNGDIFCTGRIVKEWNGGLKNGDYIEL